MLPVMRCSSDGTKIVKKLCDSETYKQMDGKKNEVC